MPLSEHIPPAANPQVRPGTRIRHTQLPAAPRTPARPPRQASCRRYAPRTTGADRTGGASRQNGRHPKKPGAPRPHPQCPKPGRTTRYPYRPLLPQNALHEATAPYPYPVGRCRLSRSGKGIRNERRLRRPVGTPRTAQKRKHRHKDNQNFFHGNSILFTVVPHSPSPDTPPEAQHRIPRRTPDRRNLSGSALQAPKTDRRRYPQPDDKESGRQAEVCRPHALMLSRTYCEARVRRPVSPAPYSCPERDRKRRTG